MPKVHCILTLHAQGWSCRRIGRELGIHRDTVRQYVRLARSSDEPPPENRPNPPAGSEVLLLGPPGTGKSHLVKAIGYQAIKAGHSVLSRAIFDVVRDFLHDEVLGGEEKVLKRYLKPDLLIIDDMGMKQLPKRSGEDLFEIIMRRYENCSTMMTSNRPLEDWGKLVGDVPSATAILDRFLHNAEMITIIGKSYRLRDTAAFKDGKNKDGKNKLASRNPNEA